MQIVEININGQLADAQARVIECESWDKYVSYFTEYDWNPVGHYISVNGGLIGYVVPKQSKIYDLEYDDHKLTCTIYNHNKQMILKIACIVQ